VLRAWGNLDMARAVQQRPSAHNDTAGRPTSRAHTEPWGGPPFGRTGRSTPTCGFRWGAAPAITVRLPRAERVAAAERLHAAGASSPTPSARRSNGAPLRRRACVRRLRWSTSRSGLRAGGSGEGRSSRDVASPVFRCRPAGRSRGRRRASARRWRR
jgi:hypothetical protein